jgi:rare lipoprotein A
MKNALFASSLIALTLLVSVDVQARVAPGQSQTGVASYYHDRFQGRKTASGVRYNKNVLSAAHKTLPLGSKVKVTDTRSGRSVVVKINDRGPYVKGRVIDLSRAAAKEIGLTKKGVAKVKVEVLSLPGGKDIDS